ncbi:hypothetical protein H2198_005485 [Neophaeococcomyces mojaviensis]|uniref:Uncharacterized protein n=1 Tax=Neophaeococcomyces mojaviensis TaxID=3383035 RepID=A0ACC3A5J9_9EURO|nr:hypothetical protein H2198_005485 [Knufia sp. JES_112]
MTSPDGPGEALASLSRHTLLSINLNAAELPSEDAAQELLDTVLSSIGQLQHFFDPREFSDRLAQAYQFRDFTTGKVDIWHIEMLLVLAVGRVLQSKYQNDRKQPPGFHYFLAARSAMPDLCTLRATGTIAIEVLGLTAFYLQCVGHREDAYIHSGTALRLCISSGLNQPPSDHMVRSQKEYRKRLWWTIYMQERRLTAAAGYPLAFHDDVVHTPMPIETPGFMSPKTMNVNIEIAITTAEIVKVVYSSRSTSETDFASNVQSILLRLAEIRKSIPYPMSLDFSRRLHDITRASATIYLMLFQAISLCTRPVLLHLARLSFQGDQESVFEVAAKPVQALAATCIDAASHVLDILQALQAQQLLAPFGFFDLDAAFSAAFVFVLAAKVHPKDTRSAMHLGSMASLFDFFVDHGNSVALDRKSDIEQMRKQLLQTTDHVRHMNAHERAGNSAQTSNDRLNTTQDHESTNVITGMHQGRSKGKNTKEQSEPNLSSNPNLVNDDRTQFCNLNAVFDTEAEAFTYLPMDFAVYDTSLWEDSHDIYQYYNTENLMLSGSIETDWDQLERQIIPWDALNDF